MAKPGQVIAIDGQTAAGKTAVGRQLALRLGCRYFDTGIMYRAITWLALRDGVSMDDEDALGDLARSVSLHLKGLDGDVILLEGRELGPELRTPGIDRHVSLVARVSSVRQEMVRQQQAIAAADRMEGIVVVGRDIGSVVLPAADLKLYMTAAPEVRARRRCQELLDQGHRVDFDQTLAEIIARDNTDSGRADSPSLQAEDAWLIDTNDRTVEQVVDHILSLLASRPPQPQRAAISK